MIRRALAATAMPAAAQQDSFARGGAPDARWRRTGPVIKLLLALPLLTAAAISVAVAQEPAPDLSLLPPAPGRELVGAKCGTCHALAIVVGQRRDRAAWEQAIDQMIGRGADVSDAEYEAITAYLGTNVAP